MQLLKQLCSIHAPSGNEDAMHEFLLKYINKNQQNWKVQPQIFAGEDFLNCMVLIFGKPRTAVFAHMDSIGFTVRYGNELIKIGKPDIKTGCFLTGRDSKGEIRCKLKKNKDEITYDFSREIERGTDLTFEADFREDKDFIQCCYLDNRLGIWNVLKLIETLENGAIVFTSGEEHGGGSVGFLARFLYENYKIRQALISDITWITEGIFPGKGVVISLRDSGIPRRSYVNKIINLAKQSSISFQIEVESSGGSDGNELQHSPFPFDWCFIGAAEEFVHSPDEKVHKKDIATMLSLYKFLMEKL